MNIAIEFNNCGVTFHGAGRRVEACVLFKGALEVMTILSRHEGSDRDSCVDEIMKSRFVRDATDVLQKAHQIHQNNEVRMALQSTTTPILVQDLNTGFHPIPQRPSNSAFVFQHPFKMKMLYSIEQHDSEACKLMMASVILYNMALMGHMKWLEGPLASDAIDTVLKFYQMAYDIIEQEKLEVYMIHLHLALLNNMGQIYHDLGQYDVSKSYMDELSKEISNHCANSRSVRSSQTGPVGDAFLEQFLLNAVLLKSPSLAGAA